MTRAVEEEWTAKRASKVNQDYGKAFKKKTKLKTRVNRERKMKKLRSIFPTSAHATVTRRRQAALTLGRIGGKGKGRFLSSWTNKNNTFEATLLRYK